VTRRNWGIFAILFVLALALRFFHLDEKPPHHDEAINGWHVLQMWKNGYYRYDPTNYHGPLLFYLLQWAQVFFGESIWTLRAVPAFCSVLSVGSFYFWALRRDSIWAVGGVVLLLSPAAQFYGRSGIHESLLALAFLICWMALYDWMLKQEQGVAERELSRPVYWFFGGLACALTLKETTSLFFFSGLVAWVLVRPIGLSKKMFASALVGFAGLALFLFVLYSGFLQDIHGVLDFFAAYLPWLKTGVQGSGHEKSFFYWSQLSLENDPAIVLLALLSLGTFLGPTSRRLRFFTVWAWLQFLLYSVIPYKTPWCLISIQIAFVFCGSLYLVESWGCLAEKKYLRWGLGGVLLVAVVAGIPSFYRTSFQHPLNLEHSFFYVQTEYSFKRTIDFLKNNRAQIGTQEVCVATSESWPLPWWIHEFNLRFLSVADEVSTTCPIQIYDHDQKTRVESVLGPRFISYDFATRQARQFAVIFIDTELRKKMIGDL
jgi:uncharacterized protein (TIGR03663 family)